MANLSNINGKFVVEQTTGYVGIGTTNPNFLIEAAGTNAELALNASAIYRVRSTSNDEFIITKNGVGDRLVIAGGGDATFSGNIGIGGAPGQNLDIQKSGARFRMIDGTNQFNMGLWDGSNYRFEGDANRPIYMTSYEGNINFGISGGLQMTVDSAGVNSQGDVRVSGGVTRIISNQIQAGYNQNVDNTDIWINYTGYQGSTTYFRDFRVGDGKTGLIAMFDGSSGNVGIGAAPSNKLHIQQAKSGSSAENYDLLRFNLTGTGAIGDSSSIVWYSTSGTKTAGIEGISGQDNILYGELAFNVRKYTTDSFDEVMRIDNRGNVGIGTTNPSVELDVRNDGANGIAEIGVRGGTNGAGVVQISGHGTTYGSTSFDLIQNSSGAYVYNRSNTLMIFGTNNTERMRITSGGDVEVQGGDLFINSGTSYNDKGYIYLSNQRTAIISDIVNLTANGDTSLDFQTRSGGSRASSMFIDELRNVGIGTTSPSYKLQVNVTGNGQTALAFMNSAVTADGNGSTNIRFVSANNNNWASASYSAYDHIWYGNGTERMRILGSNGNVGIGYTSPSYKLDVNGTLRMTSSYHQNVNFTNTPTFQIGTDTYSSGFYVYDSTAAQYRMVVKSSTGNVGIGTTSPGALLTIKGTGDAIRVESTNTGAGGAQIDLLHFTTSPADNDTFGLINMGGYYTGTTSVYGTSIKSIWTDVSARNADLTFSTNNSGTLSEKMRITSAGEILLNSTVAIANRKLRSEGGFSLEGGGYNTSYTPDGLFGATATPNILTFPGGRRVLLGYQDNGSGLYAESMAIETHSTDGLGNTVERDAFIIKNVNSGSHVAKISNLGKLQLDSSIIVDGDVAIGTTTPTHALTIEGNSKGIDLRGGNNRIYFTGYRALEGATNGSSLQVGEGYTSTKIDSTYCGVNVTPSGFAALEIQNSFSTSYSLYADYTDTNGSYGVMKVILTGASTSPSYVDWWYGATQTGSVVTTGSSTQYLTSSDYRLKENIIPMSNAIDRVKQLKPSRFNFIGHENTVDGLIAHEVAEVVPEAVNGEKDGLRDDGTPKYQGIDEGKLVPLLIGAIQELEAEIQTLKTQINN